MTLDTKRLRELLSAATPGPLRVARAEHGGPFMLEEAGGAHSLVAEVFGADDEVRTANAHMVLVAWNALPGLLDRLDEAEQLLRNARERIQDLPSQDGGGSIDAMLARDGAVIDDFLAKTEGA